MHPRNRHQDRYNLTELQISTPELGPYIIKNKFGNESIDFSNSQAVKYLNKAILKSSYGIEYWDLPPDFLCPPIPGRADYIHHVADLFKNKKELNVLDIGTGANCIYPLLGVKEYDWNFVATDINAAALENASKIITKNQLSLKIQLKHQSEKKIFESIISEKDFFHLTICNPPFHESLDQALAGTKRKWKNLGKTPPLSKLNFGGKGSELWCPGGEKAFILQMIAESQRFKLQVKWFTSLVSKEASLPFLTKELEKQKAVIKILEMGQGNKQSRVLCWTYIPD